MGDRWGLVDRLWSTMFARDFFLDKIGLMTGLANEGLRANVSALGRFGAFCSFPIRMINVVSLSLSFVAKFVCRHVGHGVLRKYSHTAPNRPLLIISYFTISSNQTNYRRLQIAPASLPTPPTTRNDYRERMHLPSYVASPLNTPPPIFLCFGLYDTAFPPSFTATIETRVKIGVDKLKTIPIIKTNKSSGLLNRGIAGMG